MSNQTNQEQISNQVTQLKELTGNTTDPTVNLYIIMALRQLEKILALNEHDRFKVWRINKAIECLCTATQLLHCTKEEKSEIVTITSQLQKTAISLT
jgi:hypothetical protein